MPKNSAIFIAKNAKHVSLSTEGVQRLATEITTALRKKELCIDNFSQHELHPQTADDAAIAWIFLVDSLNFSFWTHPTSLKKWEVTYHGKKYTGYFALCAAVNRAIDDGIPIVDPNFYSKVTREVLLDIFRGDDNECGIPLIEERVSVLHEVGRILLEKYQGSFKNCITQSKQQAQSLLHLITSEFPCFNDIAIYKEITVALHKRAQILVGDIWACFRGEGLGKFEDIATLTMFADYRVPQVLIHFGVMEYSNQLMAKLKSNTLLENGSNDEVEIRGCSIYAVQLVTAAVNNNIKEHDSDNDTKLYINDVLVDHFLWDYRRKHASELEHIPYHLTRCIFY